MSKSFVRQDTGVDTDIEPCAPPIPLFDTIHAAAPIVAVLFVVFAVLGALVFLRGQGPVSRAGMWGTGIGILGALGSLGVWAASRTC